MEDLKPCEICGKRSRLTDAIIEGTFLSVCLNCIKFGKSVVIQKDKEILQRIPTKIEIKQDTEIIVENYQILIKQAREKVNLKQKDLAEKIAEKESLIHNIESGHFIPTFKIARKLEKFFNIKLIEEYKEPQRKSLDLNDSSLTIGDMLKLKKQK